MSKVTWRRSFIGLCMLALLGSAVAVGCNEATDDAEVPIYESADPGRSTEPWDEDRVHFDDSGGGGASVDAEATLREADIVQIQGPRLYALSRGQGLSIIDIGQGDRLSVLGRYRLPQAEPFEMVSRGDVILAMFTKSQKEIVDEKTGFRDWVHSSVVVALDIADASNIREVARFEIRGELSDSRVVGDHLYVVNFVARACADCEAKVVVSSFDLSNTSAIRLVDQIDFGEGDHWNNAKRSVVVTRDRIYVAGPDGSKEKPGSTIQIIDISKPSGQLTLGASVRAAGIIRSRWQMDEHEGVLRVISQPSNGPPSVQTFRVGSSTEVSPLGTLSLTLPRPEELKSVRFDGSRAYAITFEQRDPLFTIDLEDPEKPVQRGELEMPGWILHMEPRGDRLYSLGFHEDNAEGSLHVSVFDVSDLSTPTMLDRVYFGAASRGSFRADRDRLHKTFRLLPEAGLITVPFAGVDTQGRCNRYSTGVQLIDWTGDSLNKRGVAEVEGARRALVIGENLITVGDRHAELFDIANRDEPREVVAIQLAQPVDKLRALDDSLIRIEGASLEVVPKSDPNADEPLGRIALDLGGADDGSTECIAYAFEAARYFVREQSVVALIPPKSTKRRSTLVVVVDVTNRQTPKIVHRKEYPFRFMKIDKTGQQGLSHLIEAGAHAIQVGNTVAVLETFSPYSKDAKRSQLHLLDFSKPEQPGFSSLELPEADGRTPLQSYAGRLMVGRWNAITETPSRVRFYLDRIDLASNEVKLLPPINVPGSLLAFDEANGRLVTIDYQKEVRAVESWDDCKSGDFNRETKVCTTMHRSLELLAIEGDSAIRIDHRLIDDDFRVEQALIGNERVYFTKKDFWPSYCFYHPCEPDYGNAKLMVVSGAPEGEIRIDRSEIATLAYDEGWATLVPFQQRLIVSGTPTTSASVIDARNLDRMTTTTFGDSMGYARDILIEETRAFFALGRDRIESLSIPD